MRPPRTHVQRRAEQSVRRNPAPAAAAALLLAVVLGSGLRPASSFAADPLADAEKGLAATDPGQALSAVTRVAAIEGAEARKALVRFALRGPSMRLRRAAVDAFSGRPDREQAIDSFVFRLQNPGNDRLIALHAAEALGRLPSVRAEKALLARHRHPVPEVADAVVMGALAVGTANGTFELCKDVLANDASPSHRAAVADALGRIGGDEAIAVLATVAGREPSRLVRERIVTALLAQGAERANLALFERHKRAGPEEKVQLLFAAARIPSPGLLDAARKAMGSFQPLQIAAGCLAISGIEGPLPHEDVERLADRFDHKDAVVRDAALHALLRRTAADPAARISLLETRPRLHAPARVALLASLEAVPTDAARAVLAQAARSRDYNAVATAIGALRRGHGAAGRQMLANLAKGADGAPFAGGILQTIAKGIEGGGQPRAFVVLGNADRAEEAMGALGRIVVRYTSGSGLDDLDAVPEDVVVVDGPGELEKQGEANLRRFLHLGGTLILLAGYDNRLWRALVPDAVDRSPSGLRVEEPAGSPSTTGGKPSLGIQDFDVFVAAGTDPVLAKALGPSPEVMLVPFPVPLATAAAKPLLWSSEMADQYGGDGCVAAEVRMGCGRILLMGGTVGIRGALQQEGWFSRVRVERRLPLARATAPLERMWVAYDSFGLDEGRMAALVAMGYFEGREPFALAGDHPASRWLKVWLDGR